MCAETAGRPLKINELPLKTDLVIWLPLNNMQKLIYEYLIQNQDLQQIVQDREIKNAFFILSYIKKLCLHPQLLAATSVIKNIISAYFLKKKKWLFRPRSMPKALLSKLGSCVHVAKIRKRTKRQRKCARGSTELKKFVIDL